MEGLKGFRLVYYFSFRLGDINFKFLLFLRFYWIILIKFSFYTRNTPIYALLKPREIC